MYSVRVQHVNPTRADTCRWSVTLRSRRDFAGAEPDIIAAHVHSLIAQVAYLGMRLGILFGVWTVMRRRDHHYIPARV